jgi:integrase
MRGSIIKRGLNYTIIFDLGKDEIGKRKQKTIGGFKTKREAEKALNENISKVEKGEFFVTKDILFKDYLNKWIEEYCKNNLSYKTQKTYNQLINSYIIPRLGNIPLSKLKPLNLQSFNNALQNELHLSGTTALHCHTIIHTALKYAVKWQIIDKNVSDAVERPKRSNKLMNVLNADQLNLLLDNLKETSLYLPTLLAATTGIRRGEVLGLTWNNIDLDSNTMYIEVQLQNVNEELTLVSTKTDKSRRKIILLPFTIPILKLERKKQIQNKLQLGEIYDNRNFVCCMGDGRPYNPDYISRHFLRKLTLLSEKLAIPKIRFHDLRHTHATLLLKEGINPKIVSERLGHSQVNITLDTYSHVLPDMQKEAADKLNNLLNKVD